MNGKRQDFEFSGKSTEKSLRSSNKVMGAGETGMMYSSQ